MSFQGMRGDACVVSPKPQNPKTPKPQINDIIYIYLIYLNHSAYYFTHLRINLEK